MDIPVSMQAELGAWNDGEGVDLATWVSCEGNFSLAVGYAALFFPELVEFEGYVLRKPFDLDSLRGFAAQAKVTRAGVESVMNHMHLADLHFSACPDITGDKLLVLGHTLKEAYEARLKLLFPERQFVVNLYVPEDPEALGDYQLSFWQEEGE